jgi:hypothetical protein
LAESSYVTEHLPELKVQDALGTKEPVTLLLLKKVIVSPFVEPMVSVRVAVHVVGEPRDTVAGEHATEPAGMANSPLVMGLPVIVPVPVTVPELMMNPVFEMVPVLSMVPLLYILPVASFVAVPLMSKVPSFVKMPPPLTKWATWMLPFPFSCPLLLKVPLP